MDLEDRMSQNRERKFHLIWERARQDGILSHVLEFTTEPFPTFTKSFLCELNVHPALEIRKLKYHLEEYGVILGPTAFL